MRIFGSPKIFTIQELSLQENFFNCLGNGQIASTHQGEKTILFLEQGHFSEGADLIYACIGAGIRQKYKAIF
jgi:hypothetical protein